MKLLKTLSTGHNNWYCVATIEPSSTNGDVHYLRTVFSSYERELEFDREVRGKEAFVKAAIRLDYERDNIVLCEPTVGFMIVYDNVPEPVHDAIKDIIVNFIVSLEYDILEDVDDEYGGRSTISEFNYISPNSKKTIEVAKLVDRIFANVVNMEKVEACMPDMPLDIQRLIVDEMFEDGNKYNIPVSPMPDGFILKRLCGRTRRSRRKYIAEWLQASKRCPCIKEYMTYNFEYYLC